MELQTQAVQMRERLGAAEHDRIMREIESLPPEAIAMADEMMARRIPFPQEITTESLIQALQLANRYPTNMEEVKREYPEDQSAEQRPGYLEMEVFSPLAT